MAQPVDAADRASSSTRPIVVVADDEIHVVDLIAMLLESLGVQVIKTYNGEQALQAVTEYRPRLLITDVMMPKLRGDELVARIKAHPETAGTRVVIVSSQPPDSVADAAADGYIHKPFTLDEIERVINEQLGVV